MKTIDVLKMAGQTEAYLEGKARGLAGKYQTPEQLALLANQRRFATEDALAIRSAYRKEGGTTARVLRDGGYNRYREAAAQSRGALHGTSALLKAQSRWRFIK